MVLPHAKNIDKNAEQKGMPLSVRGIAQNGVWNVLLALIPLICMVIVLMTFIEFRWMSADAFLAVFGVLFIVFVVMMAWAVKSLNRTFPVALTDEGIIVDDPGKRVELRWDEITSVTQEVYLLKYSAGFDLTLNYVRDEKPRKLVLGTMRAININPLIVFKSNQMVRITPKYDEILKYALAKGAKLEPQKSDMLGLLPSFDNVLLKPLYGPKNNKELLDAFEKAKADGHVRIVQR